MSAAEGTASTGMSNESHRNDHDTFHSESGNREARNVAVATTGWIAVSFMREVAMTAMVMAERTERMAIDIRNSKDRKFLNHCNQ